MGSVAKLGALKNKARVGGNALDSLLHLIVSRPRFFWTRIWGKTVSQERGWKC